jgi:hypothetical protein
MYVDKENNYSDAQAITASAGSTHIIDHGIARDLGTGEDIYLVSLVDVAFTDGSSDSTVTVTLETDEDVAFGSPTTAIVTLAVFSALSAIGTIRYAKLPPGTVNERYSRVYYTVANGNLTTGSITSFLTKDIHKYVTYAKGYTIS